MKYEYTISDKKHGKNRMSAGRNVALFSLLFYIQLVLFHPKVNIDNFPAFLVFTIFILFGVFEYIEGKKIQDRNEGNWTFRVDANGVYLSTPSGLTRHVTLDKIIAIEKVDLDEHGYIYTLAHEDNINFNLELPINVDFDRVIKVLEHHNIKVINLSAFSDLSYKHDLEEKGKKYQKFDAGFSF